MEILSTSAPLQASAESGGNAAREKTDKLLETSRNFEAAFLAEALSHMGLDASKGVAGSEAFSSFMNRAYADRLVERGGLGLSEHIFRALAEREESA